MIRACTYESKIKLSFGGEVLDEFPVMTRFRQGDALLTLESVMPKVLIQAKSIKMNNNDVLTAVPFADYIVFIAETENELRNTTIILLSEVKEIGLTINY